MKLYRDKANKNVEVGKEIKKYDLKIDYIISKKSNFNYYLYFMF